MKKNGRKKGSSREPKHTLETMIRLLGFRNLSCAGWAESQQGIRFPGARSDILYMLIDVNLSKARMCGATLLAFFETGCISALDTDDTDRYFS